MKATLLATAVFAALLLAACAQDAAAPATPAQTNETATADAATQTEAIYGDEAPVAIEADPASADDHAHNADGSHPAGHEHDDDDHEHGDDDHEHGDDADHSH